MPRKTSGNEGGPCSWPAAAFFVCFLCSRVGSFLACDFLILNHKIILRSCAQHVYDELVQYYYYCPTQQMNEAPNTPKQNVIRRPSRESVRALATTGAVPHMCCVLVVCVCVVLCCSLLCGYCSVLGAGGSVQVNTRGYSCRFPGTRLPYSTRKPAQYPRGVWGHARILLGVGLVFWFSIDGSQPYSTQHTHLTRHHHHRQGIAHHTSHSTHSTPEWIYVLRPPRRPEGAGNNAASSGQTLRYIVYIASDMYRCIGKILSR